MIDISDLQFGYRRKQILRGISLTLKPGELVALLGANGAGKSSLIKCLARINQPSGGLIRLDGKPISDFTRLEFARQVAYVPQSISADTPLNVFETVQLGRVPHMKRTISAADRDKVFDMIDRFGLSGHAFSPLSELSGGERQRVSLARAVVQEPSVLLLDEPTSALDLRHQMETMQVVQGLAKDHGMSVLIAMHDLSLAARFVCRVALLSGGQLTEIGAWDDVLRSDNIETAYGVNAEVGLFRELPCILPVSVGVKVGTDA